MPQTWESWHRKQTQRYNWSRSICWIFIKSSWSRRQRCTASRSRSPPLGATEARFKFEWIKREESWWCRWRRRGGTSTAKSWSLHHDIVVDTVVMVLFAVWCCVSLLVVIRSFTVLWASFLPDFKLLPRGSPDWRTGWRGWVIINGQTVTTSRSDEELLLHRRAQK